MFKNWEEFAIGPNNPREDMHVTVNDKGEIMIGATAAEKFGPHDWAVLLYDRWNGYVGVAPIEQKSANAFPIVNKSRGRHRVIRAGRFFRYHQIFMPRTTACKAELDDEGVLVLDLKATRASKRGGR